MTQKCKAIQKLLVIQGHSEPSLIIYSVSPMNEKTSKVSISWRTMSDVNLFTPKSEQEIRTKGKNYSTLFI